MNQRAQHSSPSAIPLSMGYIVAYLKTLGHEGIILDDLHDRPLSLQTLETWIQKLSPEVVGFSAYQANMERIRFLSFFIKSRHPNIRVLLGGPQAISMPSSALLELPQVDVICRGEGEVVTSAIAECIEKRNPLSSVNAITFRDHNSIIDTVLGFDFPEDLDRFPSPYLADTIDLQGKDGAMLSTARGCKYNCLFCVTPATSGRRVQCHSVKRTLDEMQYLADKGMGYFWFRDENFGGSRERALEILQGKIDRGIKTPFWCQIRCDMADEEMIERLRQAGAHTIALGLESANAGVLSKTGKGTTPDRMSRTIQLLKSAGIDVELFSIYGLPGETVENNSQTLQFVRSSGVPIRGDNNSGSQQMQLYFGSTYEKHPLEFGFRQVPGYLPAYLSIGDRYETETLTSKNFRKIRSLWFLARDEVGRSVEKLERPFEVLNFLLSNEEDLANEEAFYEYGAIVSSALEEQKLLWRFLDGYISRLNPSESRLSQLMSRLRIFKETQLPSASTSRVIFDCGIEDYWLEDIVSPLRITGRYRDVVLGKNMLPSWFEKRLVGLRQGQRSRFEFTFPSDCVPAELRSRTLRFWVTVHKVLNRVDVTSVEQLKSMNIRNHYIFPNLDSLLQENEVLFHLAVRDVPEEDLARTPDLFIAHLCHCARFHEMEPIKRTAAVSADDKQALRALAEILYSAGRYLEAADYFGESRSNRSDSEALIKEARSLVLGGELQKAMNVLDSMPEKTSLSFKELLLECLKMLKPDSAQIPQLDHEVLAMRVEADLQREKVL